MAGAVVMDSMLPMHSRAGVLGQEKRRDNNSGHEEATWQLESMAPE